jgi:hypothetical protein
MALNYRPGREPQKLKNVYQKGKKLPSENSSMEKCELFQRWKRVSVSGHFFGGAPFVALVCVAESLHTSFVPGARGIAHFTNIQFREFV